MIRQDKYVVGDKVRFDISMVMEHCRSWAPDVTKEYTITRVDEIESPHSQRGAGHTQLVSISENPSPFGGEFSGKWFLPIDRSAQKPVRRAYEQIQRDGYYRRAP
ncbi:hypothetical protein AA309_19945 [Microvirga vignae]|uniref:Uncharacterized protein n=1 Tax=Microvirga vignae TaxID=1225564 RepID=A0A0H1R975_9HYPH|nr:hypothetical protein [Microvirga vignae]KLK91376.1 hypothetical protein AA309_19945 [Microvirga vignae]